MATSLPNESNKHQGQIRADPGTGSGRAAAQVALSTM